MTTTIERSALVMYSAEAMFDLVNDVEAYPEFMEGCVAAEVFESGDSHMVAQLTLRKAGLEQRFTTRNQWRRPDHIAMALEKGPFRQLDGLWQFSALSETACKISFKLEFEFSSSALGFAASRLFTQVANNLVDSLCRRAEAVYGKTAGAS